MKSKEISFTKSFRFKIIVYSLLSLLMTILTEGIAVFVLYQFGVFSSYLKEDTLNEARLFHDSVTAGIKNEMADSRMLAPRMPFSGREFSSAHFIALILLAFVFGLVFFVLYFLLFSRRISVSIEKIAAGIEKIAAGDFNTRVQIEGEDEFALIGEKLNCMALDIQMLMESERRNEQIKNNLITNVAHDLRTPLTSVIGYLDLIVRETDLEENTKRRYMEIAYDKSLRLQKLIEDLFSYTKVSQGEIEPKLAPLDVVKLMEQMIDEFYPFFEEAGLEYEFLTSHSSIMVMADGDMLARAFSNLLGNAVKYGKDGKNIRIYINRNGDMVSICVINYGKVIPKEDLRYIFDRFYRVEGSRSEETGGSGLGLAIAKRIVLLHGGSITADSSMDGTVFEVRLKTTEWKGEAYEEKE